MTVWYEKIIFCLLPLLILFPTCAACVGSVSHTIQRPAFKHATLRDSVVYVVTKPNPARRERLQATAGTGFAISKDLIMTAGHFCDRVEELHNKKHTLLTVSIYKANKKGSLEPSFQGEMIARDPNHDLCIIYSENHNLEPLPLMDNVSIVETEDPITVIGAPATFFPVRREGRLISTEYEGHLLLAVGVQQGSSGSPVIWNGEVIGVVVMVHKTLVDGTIAVKAEYVKKFVRKILAE